MVLFFVATTFGCFGVLLWTVLMAFAPKRRGEGVEVVLWVLIGCCLWLTVQAWLSACGFYLDEEQMPPPLALAVLPTLVVIALAFFTRARHALDKLPLLGLTLVHTVRIPVEISLYGLYLDEQVPQVMTFAGQNFDVIAGVTAPLVAYAFFVREWLSRRFLLVWNLCSLALLLNIVATAILSVSSPIQRLGFDQPNEAILHFPYIWLPSFIVPVVFFSHLVAIRALVKKVSP